VRVVRIEIICHDEGVAADIANDMMIKLQPIIITAKPKLDSMSVELMPYDKWTKERDVLRALGHFMRCD